MSESSNANRPAAGHVDLLSGFDHGTIEALELDHYAEWTRLPREQ